MSFDLATLRKVLRRLLTPPLATLGVILMLAEEYLWHGLVALGERIGRLPLIRQLEAKIAALPPAGAVAVLLAPVCLAVPAKLFAVWLMAAGHFAFGLAFLLGVKVTGTALVARIYTLCEPSLMQVAWFVRVRAAILRAKDWAHRKLEATAAWRLAHRLVAAIRRMIPRLLGRQPVPPT